jgi:hypothetical protein
VTESAAPFDGLGDMATFGERMKEQERRRAAIAAQARDISNAIGGMYSDERSRAENRGYGSGDVGPFDSFGSAVSAAQKLITRIEKYDALVAEYLAQDRAKA